MSMRKKSIRVIDLLIIISLFTLVSVSFYFSVGVKSAELTVEETEEMFNQTLIEKEKLKISNEILTEDLSVLTDNISKAEGLIEQYQSVEEAYQEEIINLKAQITTLQEELVKEKGKPKWKNFRLTYYDNDFASTGKNPGDPYYGITASGRKTVEGLTVAVDPKVIPLGSIVEIKWPDGKIEERRADDTGGLIKGKRIDLYVPKVLPHMGVDQVQVRVIKKASK